MSSQSYVCHSQKGSHSGAVRSLLPELIYPCWYNQVYQCYLHLMRPIWVHPDSVTRVELLIQQLSATQSKAIPPMIKVAFMYLYVVFLVNNFHYCIVWKGKENRRCKTFHSFIIYVIKTLFLIRGRETTSSLKKKLPYFYYIYVCIYAYMQYRIFIYYMYIYW